MFLTAQENVFLHTALRHECNDYPHKRETLERIKDKIAKQEGQRRGRWKIASNDPYDKVKFYRCSECGRLISIAPFYEVGKSLDEFPYCHCGAKMEGNA